MIKIDKDIVELISAISEILDIEEQEMLYHGWRVAYLAKSLARELCPDKEQELFLAGLMHDFGAFDLPCHILHYEDLYSQVPDKAIMSHPLIGAQIISAIPGIETLASIIITHHERVDGQGFPLRQAQNEISKESQIIRIADSLSIKYHFSKALEVKQALFYLEEQSGKEFNAKYLTGAKNILKDKKICNTINQIDLLHKEIDDYIKVIVSAAVKPRKQDVERVLSFFGRVLDSKHHYTEGHSIRVANYAVLIALLLGLKHKEIKQIRIAALLHDIGKLGIPKSILDKSASLTEEEFNIIKNHPPFGVRIIKKVSLLKKNISVLEADQEHWDGSGYPKGLKGKEIPLAARIILVADTFDAMTSDRAYRKAVLPEKALAELENCAGKDFDPEIVKVACQLFKNLNIS